MAPRLGCMASCAPSLGCRSTEHGSITNTVPFEHRLSPCPANESWRYRSGPKQAHYGGLPPERSANQQVRTGLPQGRWGLRPPDAARWDLWANGQWPDFCSSNRRYRAWRERFKAAPLGLGLLGERLGGAR
ncbi:hypothetical protein SEPCBS57363_006822, partial [Sporothrix epigloea]